MPIRKRITGFAERIERKRKSTQLHPLLVFGSKHHAVWQTLVEARGVGLTAAQIAARDHNYHPQILADLQQARLVGKLGKRGSENVYAADGAGKGVIAQVIQADVTFYETDDGKFVATVQVVNQHPHYGKVVRELGKRKIKFVIPELDDPATIEHDPTDFHELSDAAPYGQLRLAKVVELGSSR